jgi:formate/nitrite transporter FocA (FNT family)
MPAKKKPNPPPVLSMICGALAGIGALFAFHAQWQHMTETPGGSEAVFFIFFCIAVSVTILAGFLTGWK